MGTRRTRIWACPPQPASSPKRQAARLPQAPGRAPRGREAPQRCPGAEDQPPEASEAPVREADESVRGAELLGLGGPGQGDGGRVRRDGRGHQVEVPGPDLTLVPGGGVPAWLGPELGVL